MKIKITPHAWIDNDSNIAVLCVSYKMFEPLKKKFQELGFELTDEEPKYDSPMGELKFADHNETENV